MLISVIIPAYNEEKTIAKVVKRLRRLKFPKNITKEIIIVDDGSTDKTPDVLSALAKKSVKIKVIRHNKNSGKGTAVKTGIKISKGDILVIQDADLEYDPVYIPKLVKPIIEGNCDVVYGTRLKDYPLRLTGAKKTPLVTHYLGNKLLSLITSLLYKEKISDMETGYKVFKKDVVKKMKLHSKRFEFEPEITAKILKAGYKIAELPIKTKPRGYNEGKKITWKDGFLALWSLVKYRFVD